MASFLELMLGEQRGIAAQLSTSYAVQVTAGNNMMGTGSEVSKFFKRGKRQDKLVEVIKNDFSDAKCKRITPLCRTHWVEHHDALEVTIVSALHDIAYSNEHGRDTMKDANGLLAAFFLPFLLSSKFSPIFQGLTLLLQERSLDIRH